MRFNPPPNWPISPADGPPPPGWSPHPAWGPPPPGWPLWVPDGGPPGPGGAPPGPGGVAGGGGRGSGPLLAAVVGVLTVSLVALGAVYLLGGDDEAETTADPGTATATSLPSPTETVPAPPSPGASSAQPTPPEESSPAAPPPEPSPAPAPAEGTLAQGETTTLGPYDVTVTRTVLDADSAMLEESQSVPEEGRFVLVYLAVTNTANNPVEPYVDLSVGISGTNGTTVTDISCVVVAPDDMFDVGDLEPADAAEGSFCIDLDPALLDGARLSVAHRDGDLAAWELEG